ncbi:TonB-dependent receptor, Outer membrane receptor for ferrienterochelin and colicins [Methylophaga frappieri]|uniref:TonB-dependent receptor, Outer membrane receptor for ferrienterochelin and colicins n=1 Tax=Methylophaga frappieri (strain ATCC BAA-2434 / DSM 25690 / JAM7) TaxID=754477 RepID=I1YHW2_METFJ|nr:TonB-dependent receptor [Methylophaga frappieri]AFJ02505.1 TonB-dependent receptor, Outer membrane receptor for ferrienterochelin and colicins [Methylophaga frappieri]
MEIKRLRLSIVIGMAGLGSLPSAVFSATEQTNTAALPPMTVVTASGYEQEIVDAPASITVITKEDLQGREYRDLTDALLDVPGVTVEGGTSTSGKGGAPQVSFRGLDPKYTLILVNGRAQNSSQSYYNGFGSGAEYSWLPPLSVIERIEVIRGPMSSLYGSDALGGVINVITKPVGDEWHGELTIEQTQPQDAKFGDSDQYRYYLSGPLNEAKTLGLTLYGNQYNHDQADFIGGSADKDNQSNSAKLSWQASKNNFFELDANYATQEMEDSSISRSGELTDSQLETDRRSYGLSHDYDWNGQAKTHSYLQQSILHNRTQDARYERLTFNTQTAIFFDTSTLTIGGQYREQETENPSRAIGEPNLKRWDGALFAENEWLITDNFALTTGARFIKDEEYGNEITPRVYGVYKFTQNVSVKGGYSTGYRTPDLKQGTDDWVEGGGGGGTDGADIGNSSLKPESSKTYELGLYWTHPEGVLASLTAYQTKYEDKIEKPIICDRRVGPELTCIYGGYDYEAVYQYINVDEAELKGLEAALQFPLSDTIRVNMNFTLSDTEITSGELKGNPLNNYPKRMFNLGLNWRVTPKLRMWSRARYKSETEQTVGGRGGPTQYPSYTVVDAGLGYDISDNVSIYGGIYNALDKEILPDDYGKTLEGRRFSAGITVGF